MLPPLPPSQLSTVISAYEAAIKELQGDGPGRDRELATQAMHELGNIMYHNKNTKSVIFLVDSMPTAVEYVSPTNTWFYLSAKVCWPLVARGSASRLSSAEGSAERLEGIHQRWQAVSSRLAGVPSWWHPCLKAGQVSAMSPATPSPNEWPVSLLLHISPVKVHLLE